MQSPTEQDAVKIIEHYLKDKKLSDNVDMNDLSKMIGYSSCAELERYMVKTKDILLKNRDFLEKTAAALEGKETLLYSDIQKIRKETTVTAVAV